MYRLSSLEWLIAVVFLLFYGFAVFALTRDYDTRHPPQAQVSAVSPAAGAGPSINVVSQAPQSSDPSVLQREADSLFGAQRFAEAIPVYRRILELKPDDPSALNDLGLALQYTGDSAQALKVLRHGAEVDPGYQRLWLSLGFVAFHSGDPSARDALTRARDLGAGTSMGQEAVRLLGALDGAATGIKQ